MSRGGFVSPEILDAWPGYRAVVVIAAGVRNGPSDEAGERLPRINALVDTYNAVSLRHVIPVGGEDLDALEGDLRLVAAALTGGARGGRRRARPSRARPLAGRAVAYRAAGIYLGGIRSAPSSLTTSPFNIAFSAM